MKICKLVTKLFGHLWPDIVTLSVNKCFISGYPEPSIDRLERKSNCENVFLSRGFDDYYQWWALSSLHRGVSGQSWPELFLFASWLERTFSVGEGNLISDKSLQSKSGCLHFVESGGRWLISAVMSTSILHKGISERRWRPLFLFFFGRIVLEGAIQYQIRSSLKSAIGKANLTPADKTLRNVLSRR